MTEKWFRADKGAARFVVVSRREFPALRIENKMEKVLKSTHKRGKSPTRWKIKNTRKNKIKKAKNARPPHHNRKAEVA